MEISGFQALVALCAWSAVMLLHAFWRLVTSREVDTVRASGPID